MRKQKDIKIKLWLQNSPEFCYSSSLTFFLYFSSFYIKSEASILRDSSNCKINYNISKASIETRN